MTKKQKIVIIGAGSLQFGLGTVGSIFNSKVLKGSEISLHDINPTNLKLALEACNEVIEKENLDYSVDATTDRKKALEGATFIVNSIEVPPRFKWFDLDYSIPHKYGNQQIMGENGGPGGLFHSLRVIPPILEICKDVSDICPNALFINYSNPMSRVCLAIKRKFPSLQFVGLCHELHHFKIHFSRILNTSVDNLDMIAAGLNHFGVLLSCKYKDTGKDAYPELRAKAPEYLKNLTGFMTDVDLNRYILEKFGYIPYTTDSHYGEYITWAWDKGNVQGARDFYNGYKTATLYTGERIQKLVEKGKGYRLIKPDPERAIPIIEGILTNSNHKEESVNLPNEGVITNIPQDLVVEVPAIINKDGLHGLKIGEYPKGLAALLRNQASVQDLVVEAVISESKEIAFQALLLDPTIESATKAEEIFDEMMKINKDVITIR